jgi:3-isopropylmalate/(R)-2-methylmalate dehydratase small subunit
MGVPLMQPFRTHTGLVAPLDRVNVDTDQIIPKQFLKRIERTGFGKFLFYDWRYDGDGHSVTEFVLNRAHYRDATVLVAGKNFGCGSSREHAAWALADYGFRTIIATSFADIFRNNAFKNGLLAAQVDEKVAREAMKRARMPGYQLTIDLEACTIADDFDLRAAFEVDDVQRRNLLEGLDEIALTLKYEKEISAYEARRSAPAMKRGAA